MNATILNDLTLLHEAALDLHARLEEARAALTDEEWDAATDGPLGEILCAAMDVEYYVEKYEEE